MIFKPDILNGLRAAVSVSVAVFQPCDTPGTKCAGKYNLLKYFADVQACDFGEGEEFATLSKTCGLFKYKMDTGIEW